MYRAPPSGSTDWPALPYEGWSDTRATLHMWTQIVGKIRMELSPWINHSWSVPLYITPRGLTTSPIPNGAGLFEIEFDFIAHRLRLSLSDGTRRDLKLRPRSVADFYGDLLGTLAELGVRVEIDPVPNELPDPIPFPEDEVHAAYDPEYAERFWRALVQMQRVFTEFRARFIGKSSPVHFFWGSFDLALTRFSGAEAPPHPGGIPHLPDEITREAYSHEVSSCGFWPGNDAAPRPYFYAYAYPTPDAYDEAGVSPDAAFWYDDLGEFLLPYDDVRGAPSPDEALLEFLHSTYASAADLLGWDREALERPPGYRPI